MKKKNIDHSAYPKIERFPSTILREDESSNSASFSAVDHHQSIDGRHAVEYG